MFLLISVGFSNHLFLLLIDFFLYKYVTIPYSVCNSLPTTAYLYLYVCTMEGDVYTKDIRRVERGRMYQ